MKDKNITTWWELPVSMVTGIAVSFWFCYPDMSQVLVTFSLFLIASQLKHLIDLIEDRFNNTKQ